ncbi:MAG: class I tRNA ligase family protein, partial [Bacteriovoracaceae bacterium]|nr:class I tRNA ligase family protein [Bacteriovoracaceae bacterium]
MQEPDVNTPSDSFSFVQTEHSVLNFWQKNNIFEKTLEKTKPKKSYIFYDGPPFATGLPHHGHLVASTLKDIIPRYFTMQGRYVSRRFGWDCHGLPIEQEIDKKLGMTTQDAVKKLGIKGYNDECRGIVSRFTKEWEKTITRLGRWVDFKNDYKTMDTPFMESVWWVFKNLWDQGLIYQGSKVVPISTAFGSVLSNFEAGSNYQDVQDPALTVLFSLKKEWLGKPTFIAAWTTTPWTLPANVGLCVGAKIDYVLVLDKKTQKQIILAKDRLSAFEKKGDFEILETFLGDKLKGLSYHPLFSFFESLEAEGAFHIFNDDYVTTSDGTGVVHLAPAFGEDDHRVMRLNGLKTIPCPVDVFGKFTVDAPPYQNLYIKDADKEIIKYLKDGGVLFDHSTIVHSYP